MFNLGNISPEERAMLKEELNKFENDAQLPIDSRHPDERADLAMLEPYAKVLEILVGKVEELEERVIKNESLVIDDLFGGIKSMYDGNQRSQSIEGLKGKYGDMFSPFEDGLKEFAPDEDLYETLYDLLEDMKGCEGFNEEMELKAMTGASQSIGDKIKALRGDSPGAMAVEVETISDGETKPSKQDAFIEKIRSMKAKEKANKQSF